MNEVSTPKAISQYIQPIAFPIGNLDGFGRLRISTGETLFDSKLLGDDRALFYNELEEQNTGTSTSTYNINKSSKTLTLADATVERLTRQTKQRFNYQPGKGQLIFMTATIGDPTPGNTKRVGYFDDKNGMWFEQQGDGTIAIGKRSYTTGSAVDTIITQDDWNILTLKDLDPQKNPYPELDLTQSMIYVFDFEWLGVGSILFGVVIGRTLYYVHEIEHSNINPGVYMTTPNLPIRWEIESDGTGDGGSLECICATVISEGGRDDTSITRYFTTGTTAVGATSANTFYALLGFRLKSTHLDNIVRFVTGSIISTNNDDFEWILILNPTVAGTFTYGDAANSALQVAVGATANTVTGGTYLNGGWSLDSTPVVAIPEARYYLGSEIDGTRDEVVLAARSLSTNALFHAGVTVSEGA